MSVLFTSAPEGGGGQKRGKEEGMMNDFWTALGDMPGELTPPRSSSSSHNQT